MYKQSADYRNVAELKTMKYKSNSPFFVWNLERRRPVVTESTRESDRECVRGVDRLRERESELAVYGVNGRERERERERRVFCFFYCVSFFFFPFFPPLRHIFGLLTIEIIIQGCKIAIFKSVGVNTANSAKLSPSCKVERTASYRFHLLPHRCINSIHKP